MATCPPAELCQLPQPGGLAKLRALFLTGRLGEAWLRPRAWGRKVSCTQHCVAPCQSSTSHLDREEGERGADKLLAHAVATVRGCGNFEKPLAALTSLGVSMHGFFQALINSWVTPVLQMSAPRYPTGSCVCVCSEVCTCIGKHYVGLRKGLALQGSQRTLGSPCCICSLPLLGLEQGTSGLGLSSVVQDPWLWLYQGVPCSFCGLVKKPALGAD